MSRRRENELDVYGRVFDVVGVEVADRFCEAFGGQRIYIPEHPRENSRLVRAIGMVSAQAVSKELGVGHVMVPLAAFATHRRRRALAAAYLAKGQSKRDIAEALGCHTRTVERIGRQLRQLGKLQ